MALFIGPQMPVNSPPLIVPALFANSIVPTSEGLVSIREIYNLHKLNKYCISQSIYLGDTPKTPGIVYDGPNYIESVDLYQRQMVYELNTEEGFSIRCSKFTGVLLVNGLTKSVCDLVAGDKILIQNSYHFWGNQKQDKSWVFNAGLQIYGCLEDIETKEIDWSLPAGILKMPFDLIPEFIKGLYQESSGNIDTISSVHLGLMRQLQILFLNMGIKTYIYNVGDNIYKLKKSPREYDESWNYVIFKKLKKTNTFEDMYRPRLAYDLPSTTMVVNGMMLDV